MHYKKTISEKFPVWSTNLTSFVRNPADYIATTGIFYTMAENKCLLNAWLHLPQLTLQFGLSFYVKITISHMTFWKSDLQRQRITELSSVWVSTLMCCYWLLSDICARRLAVTDVICGRERIHVITIILCFPKRNGDVASFVHARKQQRGEFKSRQTLHNQMHPPEHCLIQKKFNEKMYAVVGMKTLLIGWQLCIKTM